MIRNLKDQAFVPGKNYIEAAGLSTDQKPTAGIITGSRFLEVDTGDIYEFDEVSGTWSKVEDFDGDITAAVDAWLDAHPEATTTVQDGAITRAKLDADLKEKTDAVPGLKSAIQQTAEVANQIVYNGGNRSFTYRTLTIARDGYDLSIDGTSDAGIQIKLSGEIAASITSSTISEWAKEVPLKSGHRYRLTSFIISGTASETRPYIEIRASGGSVLLSKYINQSNEFDGTDENVLIVCCVPSGRGGTNLKVRITLEDITEIYELQEKVNTEKTESLSLTSGKLYAFSSLVVGGVVPSGTSTSNGKYGIQDVSFASDGGKLELSIDSLTASSTTGFAITDADSKVIERYVTSDVLALSDGVYKGTITIVSKNAKYLYFSVYKGSNTLAIKMTKPDAANANHIRFVATTGSDNNDGLTSAAPMATIDNAIKSGGKTIRIAGGKYFQSISLANAVDSIRIVPSEKDGLPILYAPNSLIAEEETSVSGYTKVYSCPCDKTFSNKVYWIYQEGVPDATTEITAEDRHPLQRGKTHRCDDTAIRICSATALEDALTEIENATVYKFFLDSENDTLYFSRPQAVSATNPIMYGDDSFYLLSGSVRRGFSFEMAGIGVKYQRVNLANFTAPVITDCFCGNVTGQGCFVYDGTMGAKFFRCEAFRVAYSSTSGDGFNAHSDNTGDAFAKQTGCFMFDCWAHDCCDDGYSDHERCETSIYGGLFENNGAGVTPAQGSHCTCYNVFSRYNGEADFFYTGNPASAEGGVGGQIACYGCVAKGKGTSNSKGYRLNGSAVRGLFVGCVAIDEGTGFHGESSANGTLINCSTVNCSTAKTSHYTAYNGTPIS